MDAIRAGVKWECALVRLHELFIFTKMPKNHIEHFSKFLELRQREGATLKLKKFFHSRTQSITLNMIFDQDV